ncbi:MAG TPA: DUF4397 domain-containing protein [Gemmatimonadales bacterium]|nr:DUF4397 domain-containing protein [Gemmatimonadales bacterium]
MRSVRTGTTAALGLGLALAACGAPSGIDNGNQGTAQVRLMNAALGAPALDLVVGGKVVATGVQFQQSSALASMTAGTQMVSVRSTGQTANLAARTINITPNAKYALVVSGSLASLALTPSVTVDTGLAKPDRANIRIINIGGDAPITPTDSAHAPAPVPLDVYFTAPGADLSALSPSMSLDARYSSYSSLIYFDPGSWVVRFTNAGTKTVVAATATIPIAAGEVRSVTLQRTTGGGFTTSVVAEN